LAQAKQVQVRSVQDKESGDVRHNRGVLPNKRPRLNHIIFG